MGEGERSSTWEKGRSHRWMWRRGLSARGWAVHTTAGGEDQPDAIYETAARYVGKDPVSIWGRAGVAVWQEVV